MDTYLKKHLTSLLNDRPFPRWALPVAIGGRRDAASGFAGSFPRWALPVANGGRRVAASSAFMPCRTMGVARR